MNKSSKQTLPDDIRPSKVEAQLVVLLDDKAFRERVADLMARHEAAVEIGSPYPLSRADEEAILHTFGMQHDSVKVVNTVDPGLLMGLTIKFHDYYFDLSLKGRLNQVFESLQA
ncbi:hypothetical protein COU89_02665 [Candidatus Roizmanbacteria bacterium CG10_big_fil_rev_8_21_14_0_10_45_7]|uniref:F-type ATPase subunit delta n=1 Tax=Candidatus Roizmanbacteria bacterium CG10_big_fil_rev_8_21_14_0_10_45_7 TaxID=1974854 RepID=A0A2M8KUN2_9BACT|nr:MAG: hypothetical protein COU89_02665 [Candidatus Roizmanbacteria bacterium CG10_big_fil_rev_8_21_14_0_10_45_7]